MQLLADGSGGAAEALWSYQFARHRLTRETIHNDVAAAGTVLQRSRMPANCRGTCERCSGVVQLRTSMLTTTKCVVKRFHSCSACVGMPSVSTTSQLTGQAATTRTIIQPHLTAHSWPCTCLPRRLNAESLARRLPCQCRRSAIQGPVSGVLLRRQLFEQWPTLFGSGLPTVVSITDYWSIFRM